MEFLPEMREGSGNRPLRDKEAPAWLAQDEKDPALGYLCALTPEVAPLVRAFFMMARILLRKTHGANLIGARGGVSQGSIKSCRQRTRDC